MKIVSTQCMRQMDETAIHQYHIPGVLLMEHAALALQQEVLPHIHKSDRIMILCGPGNNGGDGFALARLLWNLGYDIQVFCNVGKEQQSADERSFAQSCEASGVPICTSGRIEDVKQVLQHADVIVDALFGTGLTRDITGYYAELITYVNTLDVPVFSVDIASGIHGDTGQVMGCAIQAAHTISFVCYKMGMVLYPGSKYCGECHIVPITMPNAIIEQSEGIQVIDDAIMRAYLPKRSAHSHKGSYGKALMIGGSMQMPGAITLAARGALASGIGTLTLAIPEGIHAILANKLEECMLLPLPMHQGKIAKESVDLLKQKLDAYDLVIIGNGLGREEGAKALVDMVLESTLPCILDGDALYVAGNHPLLATREHIIVTPHIKEMSYLTGKSVAQIQADPLQTIRQYQSEHPGVCFVLKDEHTLIRYQHDTYLNLAGNHALAKGGSGDVLCGILAGLYGQSRKPLESAVCAVYTHAVIADRLIQYYSANAILPTHLIEEISEVLLSFERSECNALDIRER